MGLLSCIRAGITTLLCVLVLVVCVDGTDAVGSGGGVGCGDSDGAESWWKLFLGQVVGLYWS